ncbi:AraC family transcriptional regulator ligand-binding domain-containing protein [Cognatishimia sp. SS12]|uniref:AraC family transcriptional regulator n=1 Tax=Cognatishimia sp. SS12 TaxID=2979465 RepID=UPI00232C78DD|nr:AraC family transcriptional regulator [Cognatishimia sp. SS12]MDC0736832.1 AraC family transcriptional regulator ligand-binding domain-containing protein [Cognatishimia sp. SS12]
MPDDANIIAKTDKLRGGASDWATLPVAFLEDWFTALERCCGPAGCAALLAQNGIIRGQPHSRVSRDQIVQLYQQAAVHSGDEMMGLWSRPIRAGALKQLCTTVMAARQMRGALYRFSQFWNLLLDDFELHLDDTAEGLRLRLLPRGAAVPQRFGHMLILKLTHGVASWLAGQELPLARVSLAFPAPEFARDYAILFPGPVSFGAGASEIIFAPGFADLPIARHRGEMDAFLARAPRDWIFTQSVSHSLALKVRGLIELEEGGRQTLEAMAAHLNMTPRTLMRRLADVGTSFQDIKDGLRRDLALRKLGVERISIPQTAAELGFGSEASFHRAFKRWTGHTPGVYRRGDTNRG